MVSRQNEAIITLLIVLNFIVGGNDSWVGEFSLFFLVRSAYSLIDIAGKLI